MGSRLTVPAVGAELPPPQAANSADGAAPRSPVNADTPNRMSRRKGFGAAAQGARCGMGDDLAVTVNEFLDHGGVVRREPVERQADFHTLLAAREDAVCHRDRQFHCHRFPAGLWQ